MYLIIYKLNITRYLYMCDDWLSKQHSDGKTARVLNLLSPDESASGKALLMNNIGKMFYSDHIWISVAHRKTRSIFTRVQRLSCCLATVLLTMVSSAMWYGTGNEDEAKSGFTIGIISITVHQIYTSVMSGVIVAVPILIIMLIFEKVDYSPAEKKQMGSVLQISTNRKWKLPFWFVYIAYVLIFLSVLCGAFFTILYAFQWGKAKSEEWLGCLMLSIVQSILLIQPIKVREAFLLNL